MAAPDFKSDVVALIARLHLVPKRKRMKALRSGIRNFPEQYREEALLLVTVAVEITEDVMKTWEKRTMIISGICFLLLGVVLSIFFPNPTPFQLLEFRVLLSAAAAGFGVVLPGRLGVDVGLAKAGGALGVFLLVYYVNPPALIPKTEPTPPSVSSTSVVGPLR